MKTWLRVAVLCLLGSRASPGDAQELLWYRNDQLVPQASAVINAIERSAELGLDPGDYALALSSADLRLGMRDRPRQSDAARLDAALTASVARFVRDLHSGRIAPESVGFHLAGKRRFDANAATRELARSQDVSATLTALEPPARPYRQLKAALRTYRELARHSSLTRLAPPRGSLKPGDDYADALRLRQLLEATGDVSARRVAGDDLAYAGDLVDGVKHFQARHGLATDGVIGRRTFAALTTPFAVRVAQIELTLERWRWTSALERPDIVVNVPQFMLRALPRVDEQERALEIPVIVGQSFRNTRTPIFTAQMTHLIFQPYWDVPESIVERELLPLIRKDVGYLERHHMEIVRGPGDDAVRVDPTPAALDALARRELRLRQRPGPDNALGRVKFMLPNPFNVYLHDTPGVELFARSERAFSHGCIRVGDPAALVKYVLRNATETWDDARIEAALCATKQERVNLAPPLRVLVFYGTAAVTDTLGVMFFRDIYDHDAKLERALERSRAQAIAIRKPS